MNLKEETLNSTDIYDGRVFKVICDDVLLPNESTASREVVLHNGGVCVIALTEDKKIPMVRQFRYGIKKETLEIPAGKLEKGENPEECGKRELLEETGLIAKEFKSLGFIYPTPAYCSEKIYIYFARDLHLAEQNLDDDEFLQVEYVSIDDAYNMVMDNTISDAKTVAAILKVKNLI